VPSLVFYIVSAVSSFSCQKIENIAEKLYGAAKFEGDAVKIVHKFLFTLPRLTQNSEIFPNGKNYI